MGNRTMNMVSPNGAQGSQYPPFVREGSLYNLTFDEVQSQLGNTGKPLHNMNLDELLKSVISADHSGQNVRSPSISSSFDHSFLLGNIGNLNGTLSNKTIDEMWREIVHYQQRVNTSVENHLQQSSLGETTLEEFLACVGMIINNVGNHENNVVANSLPLRSVNPMVMESHQDDWLPLHMQMQMLVPSINVHHQQNQEQQQQNHQQIIGMFPDFGVSEPIFENPLMEIGYSETPFAISTPASSISSSTCSDSKGSVVGKKRRFSDEMLEKTIERRQKRMAKNRESAAKSRAKKQAYIDKLESDKSRLLKSNRWLKKLKVHPATHFNRKLGSYMSDVSSEQGSIQVETVGGHGSLRRR